MSESVQWVTITRKPTGGSSGDPLVDNMVKALEDDDPYELMGMQFPVEDGVDPDVELARCMVEEYALMGWSADQVRGLFAEPTHGKVHEIHRLRGPDFVEQRIVEVFGHG